LISQANVGQLDTDIKAIVDDMVASFDDRTRYYKFDSQANDWIEKATSASQLLSQALITLNANVNVLPYSAGIDDIIDYVNNSKDHVNAVLASVNRVMQRGIHSNFVVMKTIQDIKDMVLSLNLKKRLSH